MTHAAPPVAGEYPGGARFAFTIIDDTDVATRANVEPLYRLLRDLGFRTTKTVWPLSIDAPESDFRGSETLEDPEYLEFVLELREWGFEITWHSAAMESSRRPRIVEALERYHDLIGEYPRIHASHAENRENPYWGVDRVDLRWIRWLLRRGVREPDYYQGHRDGSEYWWGDLARRHIEYGRNLTFNAINLAEVNPSMPYHDPRRPLIRSWFSSSDAEDVEEFCRLLRGENQDRLEREGGFCIVATHFGKGFCSNGEVDPRVRRALEELAGRSGWFPVAGELLDWLRDRRSGSPSLPPREWRAMQVRFIVDGVRRRVARMLRDHGH